ncbi:MAG: T9SS type A sorting domain-containing protein [Pseudarcicella sp.]|nr:T9SS type A sorting domain-containing protein [Pseudarcicella sp.]MBP6410234.1 T9SS type A sorting domain-containing protein [Pseudarcicella sp.]
MLFFQPLVLFSQFKEIPIRQNLNYSYSKSQARQSSESLKVPFFDDFSSAINGRPNPKYWEENSGVFVNNTFSKGHPTINVATFDGQNAAFQKYIVDSTQQLGITDVLTSRQIDLSGYTAADKVMFSFFCQNGGLGEMPNFKADSLVIQFKETNGKWSVPITLDNKKSIIHPDTNLTTKLNYKQYFIAIDQINYFHKNFQFRFVAYGNREGGFDVWNIDYVYLNKNRIDKVPYITASFNTGSGDQAIRQLKQGVFKDFQSVPMKQLKVNPRKYLSDSIAIDFTNMSLSGLNLFDLSFKLKDNLSNIVIDTFSHANVPNEKSGLVGNLATIINKVNPLSFAKLGSKAILNFNFGIKNGFSTDNDNVLVLNSLATNDTASINTVIDDFYAYDDGTPETGIYISKGFSRMAIKYKLQTKDTLQAIDINFQNNYLSQANQRFYVSLFNAKNDKIGESFFQSDTSFLVKFPEKYNDFVRYSLLKKNSDGTFKGVPVDSTFYVVIVQTADIEPLVFGLDKNNNKSSHIFYDLSRGWSQSEMINGAIMVRPVVGGRKDILTGSETDLVKRNFKIYPNPSKGIFYWNNESFKQVSVYDFSGNLLMNKKVTTPELNLSNLPNGNYLLKLEGLKTSIVEKIIIKK